ncbi:aryl hydrocarbon receptor-like isoform X2 [Gambusia affinis]|uniref:aryl hydrocarbon receptor-like isoform X2 n=1 Tax=Gambusia affinis TaxID=33528 RepID=UPI001CDC9FC1|nr:aryl hydrocarbon receptor-like isoform X2 [Gambusia affinis]
MLPSTAQYAMKKRKKPVQKTPKPPPPDGAKSNPSKRHRDRLNGELDKLTSLLPFPEEVRARLDKLSVLRLSVGYLKVKSFFNAVMTAGPNGSSWSSERERLFGGNVQSAAPPSLSSSFSTVTTSIDGVSFSEGDLLLQALNGFVLVVTAEGYVFYTSPTIQDFLGFHQSDVVHQSVFELIHADDRALFRRQLHFSFDSDADGSESPSEQNSADISTNVVAYDLQTIPPENSSFLERNFCCRFRCLLDNSSGFLALNFRGRLKFLHGQNRVSENGSLVPPQLALFAIATPLQQPSILEIRTKTLIFQTKHKLDFTPIGIDGRGKIVLGYNEVEISMKGSGYSFIHAADMMYCADKHLRMMRTGETGFTFFRLLAKDRRWVWVQSNARLLYKDGRPEFIVARQRALTNEEGEEQLRLRQLQLPFNFATGEAQLYDLPLSLENLDVPDLCSAPKLRKTEGEPSNSSSLLDCLRSQGRAAYCKHENPNGMSSLSDVAFQDSHATVSIPQELQPEPAAGVPLLRMDPTIQDMVETLEQLFGDADLIEAVDVGPEELQSWENSLMNFTAGSQVFQDDMNDLLSSDILTYVAEQLQIEGGLAFPNPLDKIQNHNPELAGQHDFSWPVQTQNQNQIQNQIQNPIQNQIQIQNQNQNQIQIQIQPAPLSGTAKLSHLDFPPMTSAGFNGLPVPVPSSLQLSSSSNMTFNPSCRQRQVFKSSPTELMDPDQNTGGTVNPVFIFKGSQRGESGPAQNFVEPYAPNISSGADIQLPLSGFQPNPTILNPFRTPEPGPFPDHLDCMFRTAAAPLPNGVHHDQARTDPDSFQMPAKATCRYQPLPAGGAVVAALPSHKEPPLTYQVKSNDGQPSHRWEGRIPLHLAAQWENLPDTEQIGPLRRLDSNPD